MTAYRLLAFFVLGAVAAPPAVTITPAALGGRPSPSIVTASVGKTVFDTIPDDRKPANERTAALPRDIIERLALISPHVISADVASIQKRDVCEPFYFTEDEAILADSGLIIPNGEGGPTIPGEEIATPEEIRVSELAESASEKDFAELAAPRELAAFAKARWSLDLTGVREKLLGYKPLAPKSVELRPLKLGSAAPFAIGGALWVAGVVEAFIKEVSALDRAAAIASIIPFVGCGVNAAAKIEKGDFDGVDTAMCIIGDGLLLSPLAPLGILTHIVRAIMAQFKAPQLPTQDSLQKSRDSVWARFLDDKVYAYIYSDRFLFPDKGFRDKMNSSLAIQSLAILSVGAQRIGAVNASCNTALLEASMTAEEKAEIEDRALEAADKIRQRASIEIIQNQRQFLLDIPIRLKQDMDLSLEALAKGYNENFTAKITSPEMVRHYTQTYIGDPELPGDRPDNSGDVYRALSKISKHLSNTPLSMPSLFDIAYITGQSKGLEGIDPQTLSPRHFLLYHLSGLSPHKLNMLTLHYTLQIARLLQGKVTENQLSTLWPSKSSAENVRQLYILITMKYGRVYDEWKMKYAKRRFSGPASLFIDQQDPTIVRFLTHPDVPPVGSKPENPPYLALIIGLSTEVINHLLEDLRSENIDMTGVKIRAQRLRDMLNNPKFQEAMVKLQMARSKQEPQNS